LNGDGRVDIEDVKVLINGWQTTFFFSDLQALINNWPF